MYNKSSRQAGKQGNQNLHFYLTKKATYISSHRYSHKLLKEDTEEKNKDGRKKNPVTTERESLELKKKKILSTDTCTVGFSKMKQHFL